MADRESIEAGAAAPRTRSNYRFALPVPVEGSVVEAPTIEEARLVATDDVQAVAELLLDAYRGTIDDEGETMVEALEAAEFLLDTAVPEHSWIIDDGAGSGGATAVCIVLHLDEAFYVNLIAVAASAKRRGLGRALVVHAVEGLRDAGVTEVGAAITDGNVASERLFASLGAERIGPWPPDS